MFTPETIVLSVSQVVASEHENQEMPNMILSLDFKRVWAVDKPGAKLLSIWRPVGPPGYRCLGDVAMPGRVAPAKPVYMFKCVDEVIESPRC